MAEKKEPMGFLTPAKELERALTQMQDELSKKKADWESIRQSVASLFEKTSDSINPDKASANQAIVLLSLLTTTLVARLGIELTETHDRLTKVEKAIKELKLGK